MTTLSPQAERRRLDELRQLLRLRQLREDTARRAHEACRVKREEALRAVQERDALLQQQRADRAALADYVVGDGAHEMPRLGGFAGARRELLDDVIERNEYALIDDEEALADADRQLTDAHTAWTQARARTEAVDSLRDSTRSHALRNADARAERDTEATGRVPEWQMALTGHHA